MKNLLLIALAAVMTVACGKKEAADARDLTADDVNTEASKGDAVAVSTEGTYVWWKGSKKLGSSHEGTIPVKSGNFIVKDGSLVGGEFVFDVAALTNTDLDGEMQEKLVGHLKSADFFDVENHPESKFKILGVKALTDDADGNTHQISGSLTLRANTKVIDFPVKVSKDGNSISLEGAVNIDRGDFGMTYGNEASIVDKAKDDFIKDVVELKVFAKS